MGKNPDFPSQQSPPPGFESSRCPLCQGEGRLPVLRADDSLFGMGRDFQIVRCTNCSFHYTSPRPTPSNIGSFYPQTYWSGAAQESDCPGFTCGMKQVLAAAAYQGLKVLDVGCGEGDFLEEASRWGWLAVGVEPGRAAVERGMQAGRQIQHGSLEDVAAPPGGYNMITLLDVLEHMHDPVATLRRCSELLAPGGYLAVRSPNFASWERVLFSRHWSGLQLPTHLHHFTPAQLRRAARLAGLSVVHEEGVAISFFTSSLHEALRAWRGSPAPSLQTAASLAESAPDGAPAPAATEDPQHCPNRLNWKGRLLWIGVRTAECLARVLPWVHRRFLIGPIFCSFLAHREGSWPPRAPRDGA